MRRINQDTGKEFKRGDVRPSTYKQDGRLFHSYKNKIQSDGCHAENWYTSEALANENRKQKKAENERRKAFRENPYPKRINPKTNKPYTKADKEKGKIFWGHTSANLESGSEGEVWIKEEDWLKQCLQQTTMGNIKKRAKEQDIPIDIDAEYLLSIYPNPPICPIFGIELEMGRDKRGSIKSSPSLDRIVPELGYVKGNVIFISGYANMIKQDATPEELMKVALWSKKMTPS
tara:strand:+ start:293 stop:988 length:696 start_codon:yes stop_codon:yes gene_type:complete